MYQIKLASGDETTYHSIDELTTALQTGVVTADALIYHQRADRWLTITNHPHYQVALARASTSVPKQDGSKRQVISAVKPAESRPAASEPAATRAARPDMPPTVARAQLFEVVAEMESGNESKAPRKLTIPAPKKPESSPLRAHENVLDGVVVSKPNGNGNGTANKTTVLPLRTSQPAPKPIISNGAPAGPKLPDLGDGFDLIEPVLAPVENKADSATPQVDRLLEMLDPHLPAKVPVAPARKQLDDVEIIDLNAPLPRKEPAVPAPVAHAPVHHHTVETHQTGPHFVLKQKRNPKVIIGAAAVLVISAGLFIWKPWASAVTALGESQTLASASLPRTEAFGGSSTPAAGATPAPAASPTDSATRTVKPAVDSAPAIVRVAAPRNLSVRVPTPNLSAVSQTTLQIGAGTLVQHYNTAYSDARSELELRMLQIGFTQIFLRTRVTTTAGVQDTRRLIASASSAMRQYRTEETQIERAYQDTVGVAGRNLGWTPRDVSTWNARQSQKEAAETSRLTNLLLVQMDSVFSLLAEQDGKFQISGEAIVFEEAEAARQYGALRGWINQQADKYAGSGDALPATLRQVIKAIGATRLLQERRK